ncbi:MAG TPA: hypothetical protein VH274_03910 [Mycobacteriales bacterium]|nr:hypothetical protein [Mycobacteriales bacterium]
MHDRGIVLSALHTVDERAVDLHLCHGQVPEIEQRRVAGAEVVERDADTALA